MARAPRSTRDARVHHVYSRGVGRGNIFVDISDYDAFASLLVEGMEETGVELEMFALQPNHFHLQPRGEIEAVSKTMQLAQAPHAQRFNAKYERSGHLFQGRYHSKPIHDEVYRRTNLRYGILNAVHDGHCTFEELIDYPFTSYPAVMGKRSPIPVATSDVLRMFGDDERGARVAFERFLREGLDEKERDPMMQAIGSIARSAAAREGLSWDDLRSGRLDASQSRIRASIVNEVRFRIPTASDRQIAGVLGLSQSTLRRIPRVAEEQPPCWGEDERAPSQLGDQDDVGESRQTGGGHEGFDDREPVDERRAEDAIAEGDVEDVGDEGAAA